MLNSVAEQTEAVNALKRSGEDTPPTLQRCGSAVRPYKNGEKKVGKRGRLTEHGIFTNTILFVR